MITVKRFETDEQHPYGVYHAPDGGIDIRVPWWLGCLMIAAALMLMGALAWSAWRVVHQPTPAPRHHGPDLEIGA